MILKKRGDFLGKKIVLFFIFVAIVWGLTAGMKSVKIEEKDEVEVQSLMKDVNEIYRDELNISISELDTFNPLKTKNADVVALLNLIYEPLIAYKSDDELEYVLAESCTRLDEYNWIIKLRNNVKWHSGVTFTANDVVFTFNMLRNNDLTYSSNVKNINSIEVIGDDAIKINLSLADDFFASKLSFPIVPEYYFKGENFNNENRISKMVGTGPYKYINTSDDIIELSFNKNWWKEDDAKLQKIYVYKYATYGEAIKAFKSANIDLIVTNMSSWKEKFGTIGVNSYSFENSEYELIVPNCNNVLLADNSVRRAILQAINRENIINSIYNDNASVSDIPIHTNSKNSVTNAEYDIEKAKQILINAGWSQSQDGWQKNIEGKKYSLHFTLMVNADNKEKIAVAEKIKENLSEIGIPININKISIENIKNNIKQDKFELALLSIDIKNEMFTYSLVENESENNYANYFSEAMNSIIENLKVDNLNYDENIYTYSLLFKNDAPYIGLYFKTSTILTNKSVKGNIEPTWSNYFRNITTFCK